MRDSADETVRAYVVYRTDEEGDTEPLLVSPGTLDSLRNREKIVRGSVTWAASPYYEELRETAIERGPLSDERDPVRDVDEILTEAREALSEATYRDLERLVGADEDIDPL